MRIRFLAAKAEQLFRPPILARITSLPNATWKPANYATKRKTRPSFRSPLERPPISRDHGRRP